MDASYPEVIIGVHKTILTQNKSLLLFHIFNQQIKEIFPVNALGFNNFIS